MAVSIGKRTVSIFGPVDEKIYGPYPKDSDHIVISSDGMSCRPCYKKFKYNVCKDRLCLKNIKTEKVLEAASALLSKDRS